MNDVEIWSRLQERERQVRCIDASAWKLPTGAHTAATPRDRRASWLRRALGGRIIGVGTWVAGAATGPTAGRPTEAS